MHGDPGQAEIAIRLALALLLGTVVGLERERGERAAGMRTHALVCLGSCLIMIVSAYGLLSLGGGPGVGVDPSRIAAQVVSGIGFLGAGAIILRREVVRGLTTAAGIWVVAGIGLAIGAGMYLPAVTATIGTLVILTLLKWVERQLFRRPERLWLHVVPQEGQLSAIRGALQRSGAQLRALTLESSRGPDEVIRLDLQSLQPGSADRLIDALRAVPGLTGIEGMLLGPQAPDLEEYDIEERPGERGL